MSPTTGYCQGCARTIDEIIAWGHMDDHDKATIVAQLEARKASLNITKSH